MSNSGRKLRSEILHEAEKCICVDRNLQYGDPLENFQVIGGLWSAYLGKAITPHDVAVMMALYKIGRIRTALEVKADNYIDSAGYIAIAGEIETKEASLCATETEGGRQV